MKCVLVPSENIGVIGTDYFTDMKHQVLAQFVFTQGLVSRNKNKTLYKTFVVQNNIYAKIPE